MPNGLLCGTRSLVLDCGCSKTEAYHCCVGFGGCGGGGLGQTAGVIVCSEGCFDAAAAAAGWKVWFDAA